MLKIKQAFHHFSKWEDFKNGLYTKISENHEEKVHLSRELLSNQEEFYDVAIQMLDEWEYSAEQNMTDNMINKKAWIGQASCCYNHQAPDYVTIEAWWSLPDETKRLANNTAKEVIRVWRSKHIMKGSLWQS